ncbi:MAG: hypothetical protein ACP5EQ_07795 [Candidatus Cloacimonadia bacterium]
MPVAENKVTEVALKENIPQLFADIFFNNLDRCFKVRDLDVASQEDLKAVLAKYFREKPDEYWSELFAFVMLRKSWNLRDIARELSRKISLRLDLKNRSWEEVENIFKSKDVFAKCVKNPSKYLSKLNELNTVDVTDSGHKLNKGLKGTRSEQASSDKERRTNRESEKRKKFKSIVTENDENPRKKKKYIEEYGDRKQEIDRRKRKRRKRDTTEREEEEAARRAIELGLQVRRREIWD